MADAPMEGASGGGWFESGWSMLSKVAEQVVEAYKEDLGEFVGAVATDTTQAVEDVRNSEWVAQAKTMAIDNAVVKDLVEVLVKAGAQDDNDATAVPASRLEAKLGELQRDIGTFCTNPTDVQQHAYQLWSEKFNVVQWEEQIVALLAGSSALQANHSKLVPAVVSYEDFWKRYLFREQRLREREAEREQLIRKVTAVTTQDEDMPWEVDDEVPASTTPNVSSSDVSAVDLSALVSEPDLEGWGDDIQTPSQPLEEKKTADDDWTGWE